MGRSGSVRNGSEWPGPDPKNLGSAHLNPGRSVRGFQVVSSPFLPSLEKQQEKTLKKWKERRECRTKKEGTLPPLKVHTFFVVSMFEAALQVVIDY